MTGDDGGDDDEGCSSHQHESLDEVTDASKSIDIPLHLTSV